MLGFGFLKYDDCKWARFLCFLFSQRRRWLMFYLVTIMGKVVNASPACIIGSFPGVHNVIPISCCCVSHSASWIWVAAAVAVSWQLTWWMPLHYLGVLSCSSSWETGGGAVINRLQITPNKVSRLNHNEQCFMHLHASAVQWQNTIVAVKIARLVAFCLRKCTSDLND